MNIHLTEEETARHTDNYPEVSPSVLNEELDSLFVHIWRWLSHAAMQEACFHAFWNHPGLFHCSLKVKTRVGFDNVTKENPKQKWSYNTNAESPADFKFTLF